MDAFEAKERLYLTADKGSLVGEGHADGAFLYAAPGDLIPVEAHTRFGLTDGALPKKKAATAPVGGAGAKAAAPPANKGGKAPANKGGKAPATKGVAPVAEAPAGNAGQNEGGISADAADAAGAVGDGVTGE